MKEKKPIIVCRPLFYTVLKYIYVVILAILLLVASIAVLFADDLPFFGSIVTLVGVLVGFFILYLFCNWLYKCILKTMLALTDKELHFEFYRPFIKFESTMPLESIKKVSTYEFFWIFRVIIIHQYHKMPLIFPTWNNDEMKAEINKLIIKEDEKVKNEGSNSGIVDPKHYKIVLIIIGCVLGLLIIISGFTKLANYLENKKYYNTFENGDTTLVLKKDNECVYNNNSDCTWYEESYKGKEYISVSYEYEEEKGYYYTYTTTETEYLDVKLDFKHKTFEIVED